METILHLLPLTGAQKAAFQAAAPESEHLFLPTNDRGEPAASPRSGGSAPPFCLAMSPPISSRPFPT